MDNIKEKFLEVLADSYGIVLTACKSCDLPRSTYYKWLNSDEMFKERVDEIQEMAIDFVESKLIQKINGIQVMSKGVVYQESPSDTAIIFFLKTKGRKRGYAEKTDLNISGNMHLQDEPVVFE